MSNLFFAIECIDESFDDDTFYSAFEEALQFPAISDSNLFAGITTIHLQDDIISRDTQVFCEAIDIDGQRVFGTVTSWHTDPYDLFGEATEVDYAYILTSEGATYAHEANIIPLHETIEVNHETTLSPVPNPVTAPIDGNSAPRHAVLLGMQETAYGNQVAS